MTSEIKQSGITKNEKMYYIHSAIGLSFMFLFGFLPPFGPVTEMGMRCLGIFAGLLYCWSTVDMGWPILAAFVSMVVFDVVPISQIYTSAFANPTVMLCLFNLLVLMPLASCGVFDYVAVWVLKQPAFKGHPWRLTIGLFAVVYVGSVIHAGLALLFMVYELVYKICDLSGIKRSHPWAGAIVMGSVLCMMMGAGIFPFSQLALFYAGLFSAAAVINWPFMGYIAFMLVLSAVMMGLYLLFMKLLRLDLTPLKEVDIASHIQDLPPMSKFQKQSGILLLIFMGTLIFTAVCGSLPANPLCAALSKLGLVGVSWVFMCIMVVWRVKEKAAYSLTHMASRAPWDAVLITCLGMAFGPVVTSDATGITELIYQVTSPILSGHSPFVFVMLLAIVALILTNFFNNTVIAMLMIAVVASYSETMDLNMVTVAALILVSTQIAFLTPGACFNSSLAHGQAEHIGRKSGFFWGFIIMVCGIIALPIMLTFGNMIF